MTTRPSVAIEINDGIESGGYVARRSKNEALRIPTMADFTAFDGAHCRDIYRSLQPGWTCPGCGRSTFEILRWTLRFPRTTHAFEGWVGGYHKHHDHSVDDFRYGRTSTPMLSRFETTIICEQCNSADGMAKRKLGLRKDFSFAPCEIRRFVTAKAHGFHHVDYEVALAIYAQVGNAKANDRTTTFFPPDRLM